VTGFAVRDATGAVWALRRDRAEALEARCRAEETLDDAATCGHPVAPGWVQRRLPVRVELVSDDEYDLLAEDGAALDREGP
jgi:hypothetical protein